MQQEIMYADLKENYKYEIKENTYTNTEEFMEKLHHRNLMNFELDKPFGLTKEECGKDKEWKAEICKR